MAPITNLSVLAFASAALAVPHAQWQPFKRHAHAHAHPGAPPTYNDGSSAAPAYGGSSSAAAPAYGSSSAAGAWGSSSAAGALSSSAYPSGYAYGTGSGYAHSTGWGYGTGYSARPTGYSASASGSYSVCTETSTLIYRSTTEYSTYYVTHTVYESESASVSAAPAGSYAASSYAAVGSAPAGSESAPDGGWGQGASCVPDVTVTTTERSTIYVTPGASSGAAAASSYVIPDKGHSYGGGGWGASSEASAAPSGSVAAPSYGGAPSGSVAAPSGSAAAPSYSAAPSSAPGGGSSGYSGKRGLAYNDASLCDAFEGTDADAWAYNWGSSSSGLTSSIPFIPMLWGPSSEFTDSWDANAKAAIAGGAPYLFSFNEPDNPSQANLSPEAAAAAWKQYMEPYAGQAKLVAPSVTNGQAPMGVAWLKEFLSACSDCTIDAVNMHWYYAGNPIDTFKSQLTEAAGTGKPLWLTEFGATGSDDEISQFLETVMPWMDSNDSILGYSYFMVKDGLLVDGNSLSSYGQTYAGSS